MTVGDSIPDISSVLRCALRLGELVIVTGGLGPTSDDITREATADALGRGLVTEEIHRAAPGGALRSHGLRRCPSPTCGRPR